MEVSNALNTVFVPQYRNDQLAHDSANAKRRHSLRCNDSVAFGADGVDKETSICHIWRHCIVDVEASDCCAGPSHDLSAAALAQHMSTD